MSTAAADRPRLVAGLRLVRLVGHGGEGEVWEARDDRGRRRALKLIRPDALAPDAHERSRHLLAIDHPALVRVFDGGRFDGGVLAGWGYLEMAFVDGASLHEAPPEPAVLDRLWPLAEALDLLHAGEWTEGLPLVHRDVKPANLVEDASGQIVLVDPSTLRGLDATQFTRIGTPVFSAPEVMTGRFGPPADVYSFAATVVALLTGARGEALAQLLDEAHALDLPPGVADALSPVPGDRPASCRDVLEAGTELADDTTVFLPALRSRVPSPRREPPGEDRTHRPAVAPRRHLWPWVTWFAVLLGAPLAAHWSGLLAAQQRVTAAFLVAGGHLLAQLLARESLALAVFVPPVSWGVLLGRRVAGGTRRRAWGAAVFTAAFAPLIVLGVRAAGTGPPTGAAVSAAALATVGLVVVVAAAANAEGAAGVAVRLLLTPLWAAGAAVLVVGGILLAPFGVARGTAWTAVTSLLCGLRPPAMMPRTSDPTWR